MIHYLQFYATGGTMAICLKKPRSKGSGVPTKDEIITENYHGQCLCFSEQMTINDFPLTKCRKMRISLTPNRQNAYIETGDDILKHVFLQKLDENDDVKSFVLVLSSVNKMKYHFEEPNSVFDRLDTKKMADIRVDKRSETKWTSNIGPTTTGSRFKVQFKGLLIYNTESCLNFSMYFDELRMVANEKHLLLQLLVQGKVVQTFKKMAYFKNETKYVYGFLMFVEGNEVDTDEDTSDGTSSESSDSDTGGESKNYENFLNDTTEYFRSDFSLPSPQIPISPQRDLRMPSPPPRVPTARARRRRSTDSQGGQGAVGMSLEDRISRRRRRRSRDSDVDLQMPPSVVRLRQGGQGAVGMTLDDRIFRMRDPSQLPDDSGTWHWDETLGRWIEEVD